MIRAALRFSGRSRMTKAAILPLSCFALVLSSLAQTTPKERTFPESPTQVETALKSLQSTAGRLPVLDGFVVPGRRPLERYQRGYYQCTIKVSPAPSGGSLVGVTAKITAWYEDPDSSQSGYQVLPSNGRIESDLLDRLADTFGSKAAVASASPPVRTSPAKPEAKSDEAAPTISAPTPRDTLPGEPIGGLKNAGPASPFKLGTPASEEAASLETRKAVADKHVEELRKEAKNLQEILKNQTHPTNLAAVRKGNTPVLTSPSEGAKVLFLASAEDEFEILDSNASWVHVRISGLSRGWIRRSNLEMAASPTTEELPEKPTVNAPSVNVPPFQVENEQIASFPGDWGPLRGKTVKIISVQKAKSTGTGSQAKLEFAKSIFDREYRELTKMSSTADGVVVIFDSEDGGMLAATLPVLQLWKAGTLSDEAFWRRCFFDPPELFSSSGQ